MSWFELDLIITPNIQEALSRVLHMNLFFHVNRIARRYSVERPPCPLRQLCKPRETNAWFGVVRRALRLYLFREKAAANGRCCS